MQYMALIYSDEEQWAALSDDERQGMYAQYRALSQDAQEAGVMAGGNELGPTRDATTVRVRGDETLVTDGPCRGEGGARRLLLLRVRLAGCGARLGSPYPRRGARRRRGTTRPLGSRGGSAVKYAMLIYGDDSQWVDLPDDDKARLRSEEMPEWIALFEELGKADPSVSGKELNGRGTAKVIRVRDGERIVTDGPFAETKEIVGGAFVIDLPDLDEAIRLAALVPAARHGSIEIRPVVQ